MRDVWENGPPAALSGQRLIDRAWFSRPAVDLAPGLLGVTLARASTNGVVAVRITEVEAYEGRHDPGSHGYRGQTARNSVMFGPPGHMYVYFTYGMHWCANVVCGPEGEASAVLIRAGVVVQGHDLARTRRPAARRDRDLARGPARLANALGLTGADNGADLCAESSEIRLSAPAGLAIGGKREPRIRTGPRVGLALGSERPWRFWLDGEPSVSDYRARSPRRPKRS